MIYPPCPGFRERLDEESSKKGNISLVDALDPSRLLEFEF